METAKACRKRLRKAVKRLKPKSDPINDVNRRWIGARCARCMACEGALKRLPPVRQLMSGA